MSDSILFITCFLILCNYFQLITFLSLFFGPRIKTSRIKNKWILETLLNKTKLQLRDITIFHDKRPYGMMAGCPPFPKMILSEGLYKSFNKDELEWVILHEAGHNVLWHNFKAVIIQILIGAFGLWIIVTYKLNFLLILFLSFLFSLLCIQIIRRLVEYEADKYSINLVTNPKGVITAQKKLNNYYRNNLFNSEDSIVRWLLHWNIKPSTRIMMASSRVINTVTEKVT